MMEKRNNNRWFYVVIGVIVLLFAGLVYAWSVMSIPIGQEFADATKAQLSLTFTLTMVMFCIGCMVGGVLAGKINVKFQVWASGVLFLVGFMIAASAGNLVALYLGFGVIGGLGSGLAYNAVISTMVSWFPDKSGLISGILLMGFGISGFIIGKAFQAFSPAEIGGWRITFRIFAIVLLVVMIVCGCFFKKPTAADVAIYAPKATGAKAKTGGIDVGPSRMLRTPSYWMYYLWGVCMSAAGLVLVSQASGIALEVSSTISAGAVATAAGLISVFNGVGRVVFGFLYDKKGHRLTLALDMVIYVIAVVILLMALKTGSFSMLVSGFVVGGFAYGCVTPANSALIRSFFGSTHYPINFSIVNTILLIASFGSTIAGRLYDNSGSYTSALFMIIILCVVGFVCWIGIRMPKEKA